MQPWSLELQLAFGFAGSTSKRMMLVSISWFSGLWNLKTSKTAPLSSFHIKINSNNRVYALL